MLVSIHVLTAVFAGSSVKGSRRMVLLVLAEHADDNGSRAFPSVQTIARKAGLAERTVQYALRSLEDNGLIEREGFGPRGTISYRVLLSRIAPEAPRKDGSGAKYDSPSGATLAPPGATGAPRDWPTRSRSAARSAAARNGEVPGC